MMSLTTMVEMTVMNLLVLRILPLIILLHPKAVALRLQAEAMVQMEAETVRLSPRQMSTFQTLRRKRLPTNEIA